MDNQSQSEASAPSTQEEKHQEENKEQKNETTKTEGHVSPSNPAASVAHEINTTASKALNSSNEGEDDDEEEDSEMDDWKARLFGGNRLKNIRLNRIL